MVFEKYHIISVCVVHLYYKATFLIYYYVVLFQFIINKRLFFKGGKKGRIRFLKSR